MWSYQLQQFFEHSHLDFSDSPDSFSDKQFNKFSTFYTFNKKETKYQY